MSRILVIGGFGFYGQRVVEDLRARGHSVLASARALAGREGLELELQDPEAYAKLGEFELVVNASDSVGAPPDALAKQVLEFGGTWIEMSAHEPTVERLLELDVGPHPLGSLIIGAGLFPGLSTVLARAVVEAHPGSQELELGVRLSPLSGAGPGNCALMSESLYLRASRYEDGALRRSLTAIGARAELEFSDGVARAANVTLPDTILLRRATKVPTITTYLSVSPAWLQRNFTLMAWLCALTRPLRRPLTWLLTRALCALRVERLRETTTRVELVAIVNRGGPDEARRELCFDDGQGATALGAGAAVEAWLRRDQRRRPYGVFGLAELFTLAELSRYFEPPAGRTVSRPSL